MNSAAVRGSGLERSERRGNTSGRRSNGAWRWLSGTVGRAATEGPVTGSGCFSWRLREVEFTLIPAICGPRDQACQQPRPSRWEWALRPGSPRGRRCRTLSLTGVSYHSITCSAEAAVAAKVLPEGAVLQKRASFSVSPEAVAHWRSGGSRRPEPPLCPERCGDAAPG